jgi:hypothetical protein
MMKKIFILFLIFYFDISNGFSQVKNQKVPQQQRPASTYNPNVNSRPSSTTTSPSTDFATNPQDSTENDSLPPFEYKYFYLSIPQQKFIEKDTNLGNYFKDIELSKRRSFNMLNLGNNGSPLLNPLFIFTPYTGFHSGLHQYDMYNFSLSNLPYFDSERTMADAYFSQIAGNQGNFEVGMRYGQKFNDDVDLSVNYRRILQEGFYKDQTAFTTNFSFALRFGALKRRLKNTFGLISNKNNELHNGGVLSDLKGKNEQLRLNVPVALNEAENRYVFNEYFLNSEYSLTNASPDSSSSSLGVIISYKSGSYKYGDNNIDNEAKKIYKFDIADIRGIRNYFGVNTLSTDFFIRGNFKFFKGKLGLTYDRFTINDGESKAYNDVTLNLNGITNIGSSFSLNTEAKFGLGSNVGAFYINGNTNLNIGKAISLYGKIELFNSQKAYIDEFLFINGNNIYNESITNQFGNQIYGALKFTKLNTEIFVGQLLLNNQIYRTKDAKVANNNNLISTNYIGARNKLHFWRLNWENSVYLQSINSDIIQLPKQYLKSDFYYEGFHFNKNLLIRVGAEYIYIPVFKLNSFYPITGHYYSAGDEVNSNYKNLDLYLSAQITKFRLFVKWENYLDVVNENINYLVDRYPQFDNNIRFGVRWLFLD